MRYNYNSGNIGINTIKKRNFLKFHEFFYKSTNTKRRKRMSVNDIVKFALAIVTSSVINAVALFFAARITKNDTGFPLLFLISFIFCAVSVISFPIGLIIGVFLLLTMLCKMAKMDFWPDALLTVIFATAISYGIGWAINYLSASGWSIM